MAIAQFLEEERVSVTMAILAVIFVVSAVGVAFAGMMMTFSALIMGQVPVASIGVTAFTLVFGIISGILQVIVLYQWSKVMNQNITNTERVFQSIKERLEDPLRGEIGFFLSRVEEFRVITWPFWIYVVTYIIGLFTGMYALLFYLIGFIFVAVYLSSIFKSANKLSDLKDKIYRYLQEKKHMMIEGEVYRIKRYNIIVFIILSIITFAIYWLYVLVKLSVEINRYVETDETIRARIEQAFLQP